MDCCHALGYVSKVCEYLAGDAKEAKAVYGKARRRLLEHDFERAEKYLESKYGAVSGETAQGSGVRQLAVGKDVSSFSVRARTGRADSAPNAHCLTPDPCEAKRADVGQRCKGAGMHWRYENALYVTALRARMRSAA